VKAGRERYSYLTQIRIPDCTLTLTLPSRSITRAEWRKMKTVYVNMIRGNTLDLAGVGDGFVDYLRIALN
jgi:hypothetical protein